MDINVIYLLIGYGIGLFILIIYLIIDMYLFNKKLRSQSSMYRGIKSRNRLYCNDHFTYI